MFHFHDFSLFVRRWEPSLYAEGMHRLVVSVDDAMNNRKSAESEFSLDDRWSLNFTWRGMFLILTDLSVVVNANKIFNTLNVMLQNRVFIKAYLLVFNVMQ